VYLSIWFGPPNRERGFGGWYRVEVGVLPPGERRVTVPGLGVFNFHLRAEPHYVNADIFFVDSSGSGWRRIYTGELKHLDEQRYATLIKRRDEPAPRGDHHPHQAREEGRRARHR
jgi:hypothetical protein